MIRPYIQYDNIFSTSKSLIGGWNVLLQTLSTPDEALRGSAPYAAAATPFPAFCSSLQIIWPNDLIMSNIDIGYTTKRLFFFFLHSTALG